MQDPVAEGGVLAQLSIQVLRNDYVECGTEVYNIHTYVSV